jgi:hypothetical protein
MKIFSSFIDKSVFFLILFTLSSQTQWAQGNIPCPDLGIENSLNLNLVTTPADVGPGDEFCVEFTSEFFTSIVGFQFTLNFDPTLISYVSFTDNMINVDDDPLISNVQQANNGIITILWIDFATAGLSIPDGTTMFTLCFRASQEPTECVPLGITSALAPLFPESEVNYQVSDTESCKDSIILVNGAPSTCIEINCTDLAITDFGYCNSNTGQGSVQFSACGGALPYTVLFQTPNFPLLETINNDYELIEFNGLPAGVYMIQITDAMGATVNRNVIIDAVEPLSYDTPIVTQPICANISNGSISIENITSGLPGELFDVSFSTGITFQDVDQATIERLFNGDYSVTITDSNGCEVEEEFTLFTPPLELDVDLTPATCFGSEDGAISATASGGTPFPNNEYEYNNSLQGSFETLTPFQDNAFNNITNRYRLRVVDANGCSIEENIEVPTAQEIELEIVDVIDNNCKFACEGSLTLNVLTPGRYTFLVRDENNDFLALGGNNGQSLFYNQELCAGRYSVVVRDTSGCAKDTFFEILEPMEELIAEPVSIMAACNTDNGQAIVNVSGGMAPYSYAWEAAPALDNDTLSDVIPGIYNVQVTDDLGCVLDTFVEVVSGEELEIEAFVVDNLECDGGGEGELSVNILTSTANDHEFIWQDQNQNVLGNEADLSFNSSGTYIVNVMSVGNDCEASDTIIIDATPGLDFELVIQDASCTGAANGSVEVINIEGGAPPYSCIWEDPSIDSCNPDNLTEGTYALTVTDSEGCTSDTLIEISAGTVDIVFEITSSNTGCEGEAEGMITIDNISGGTGPYACVWEDPSINTCSPSNLSPGTYNFAVIDVFGCAKDSFAVIPEITSGISYDLTVANPECGGDPGSIFIENLDGANPPINVSWSEPGASGTSATNLSAGDITISFEDARGCSTDTIITLINENTDLELVIDATPPDCAVGLNNGTISFPGFDSSTGTCIWDDPDLNPQNCTLIGLAPGIYNVTLTDINGCQLDTFVDLTVDERLEIELSDVQDVSCFGSNDGQALATVSNNPLNAASVSFFWSNPDDNGDGLDDTASQLEAGANTVYAFDGLCTSDTIEFNIGSPEIITLDDSSLIVNDVLCFGECTGSANLSAVGGTVVAGYDFLWEDGFIGASRDMLCPGSYLITITDDNNCMFVDSILIEEPELLSLAVDSSSLILISCGNDNTGSMTVNAQGGCGNYSYQWTDDVSTSVTATELLPGIYNVTVIDDCGCTATTSYEFESAVPIEAEAVTPEIPLCTGDQVCIGIESVSGGTGSNYTYSINFGARLPIDSCVFVDPGNYTLLVFDSAGCSDELSVEVESPPSFDVSIGDDIELTLGETEATIEAMVIGGTADFSYAWNSATEFNCLNGGCSSISLEPFAFTTVELIVTDQNGCTARDALNIDIKAERNVYLPNVFNPEAFPPDNKFMPLTGRGVEEVLSFRIFDRWGNIVFETNNIAAPTSTEDGWDGRRGDGGNNRVEQGVYIYTAEIRFIDGAVLNYSGEVTLVR